MTTLVDGGAIPVGAILPYGGGSIPDGFLLCNGAEINRNTYADLFAAIGTAWGSGNGSTTFRIPTTQGLFLRGRANGSGYDPDRNSRNTIQSGSSSGDNVGSYQNDRIQTHRHQFYSTTHESPVWGFQGNSYNGFYNSTGYLNSANKIGFVTNNAAAAVCGYNGNDRSNRAKQITILTTNNGGGQTCPNNVYVNYIIKY